MRGRRQRIVVVVLAALPALVLAVAGQAPASVSVGQVGRIDHVADGDTVDLTNGAKIRLVQIDINIHLVAVGAAAPYFYSGRKGRYAARLTRLALSARRRHLGLGRCPRTPYDPYRGVSTGPPR